MELVYLWVEEYKNIHRQGFNFSPRFRCEFKAEYEIDAEGHEKLRDDCELVICDKEDTECKNKEECKEFCIEPYIKDFFGDNINVTAIVGKNGSGKSSVFEVLSQILIENNKLKYFYVLFDGENTKIYTNNIYLKGEHGNEKPIAFKQYVEMYYLNISHLERDMLIRNDAREQDDPLHYLGIYAKNDFEKSVENSIYPSFSEFNLDRFNFMQVYSIGYLLMEEKYESFLFDVFKINRPSKLKIDYDIKALIKIQESNTKTDESDNRAIDGLVPNKITKILEFLDNNTIVDIGRENYNKFFTLSSSFYNSETNFKLTFVTDANETIKFSAGELTVLYYLNKIDDMLRTLKKKKKYTILLWDEIELYLHPMWQKKILKIILDFIKIEKLECLLHIIISSHSPFLLSDIPKQNIIFLDTDEEGNCKVVDGLNDKKETFGANIHTLLSDSFFMDDGLMGEFAKSKINEIIAFHDKVVEESKQKTPNYIHLKIEYEENKTKFWQTQSIIGEEYLKQVIKNHLIDIEGTLYGVSIAKKEEAQRLRKEADRLDPQHG